jgi:hypothetical protein
MALPRTLGTSATTSLQAMNWSGDQTTQANVAAFAAGVFNDGNVLSPSGSAYWSNADQASKIQAPTTAYSVPGALELLGAEGRLVIPNRGILKVLPGDYIAFDATTGWPILISALAIANGPYTHT